MVEREMLTLDFEQITMKDLPLWEVRMHRLVKCGMR